MFGVPARCSGVNKQIDLGLCLFLTGLRGVTEQVATSSNNPVLVVITDIPALVTDNRMFSFPLSEMKEFMKEVAKMAVDLTIEERNLLSVAYKNVIGARRASWRIISSIETKEESKSSDSKKVKCVTGYREQVQCLFPVNKKLVQRELFFHF